MSGNKEEKRQARVRAAKAKKTQKVIVWLVFIVLIVGGLWWLSQLRDGGSPATLNTADDTTVLFEDDWIKGGEGARVTLVEYGDFQCPACGRVAPVVKEVSEHFGDQLRIVFRHFPLTSIHQHAQSSSQAAEAAGKQGKFWEMHDMLFEHQNEWSSGSVNPVNVYTQYAEELGLDLEQFGNDFNSREVKNRIARDARDAADRNLGGTPSFLLNGEQIPNPGSLNDFIALIQAAIDNAPAPELKSVAVHEHADFAVYLNGKQFDFTKEEYQSPENNYKHEFTHLHDGVGTIIHKHQTGVTLGDFFESIGMNFSKACFSTDDGEKFCNTNTKSLKFFVNGEENTRFGDYELQDLDQILISYGPVDDTNIDKQLKSITDEACIYSETCPERGAPPTEQCVGGLGSNCEAGDHTHDDDDAHE